MEQLRSKIDRYYGSQDNPDQTLCDASNLASTIKTARVKSIHKQKKSSESLSRKKWHLGFNIWDTMMLLILWFQWCFSWKSPWWGCWIDDAILIQSQFTASLVGLVPSFFVSCLMFFPLFTIVLPPCGFLISLCVIKVFCYHLSVCAWIICLQTVTLIRYSVYSYDEETNVRLQQKTNLKS